MDSNTTFAAASLVVFFAGGVAIAVYLLGAWVCCRIGRKFGIGSFGGYCIPVYNIVLMCRWIDLPGWVAVWFYVPWFLAALWLAFMPVAPQLALASVAFWLIIGPLSLAFHVYFWGAVAARLGKSFWLYGLTTVFFFGLPVLFLAFDDSAPLASRQLLPTRYPTTNGLSLYCVTGELAQATLTIPGSGLYIGRNPLKANLILKSDQISNVHARVWPDPHVGGVWVEDWNSLNGTYYCPPERGPATRRTKWKVLHGRILLSNGSRFRLGAKVAEFEVRAS